jgi:hypothetical protein
MQTYLTTCAAFMSQGQEAPRYLAAYSCVVDVLTTLPFSITAIGLSELNTCAANVVTAGAGEKQNDGASGTINCAMPQLAGPADVIWKLVAHVYWVIRLAGRELRRHPSRHWCVRDWSHRRHRARHVGWPQPGACVASEREVSACEVCANPCDLFLRECVSASARPAAAPALLIAPPALVTVVSACSPRVYRHACVQSSGSLHIDVRRMCWQ